MDINRKRVDTMLLSKDIVKDEAVRIGQKLFPGINEAFSAAMDKMGEGCSIGVVTHGADIYFKTVKE